MEGLPVEAPYARAGSRQRNLSSVAVAVCVMTRFACHSQESAIPTGGRRAIPHCVENTQSEISRSAAGHVIPAKAGIHFVGTWTSALRQAQGRPFAGVTSGPSFPWAGRGPMATQDDGRPLC